MTIPGVGIRTAETFVAWVDDVTRFRRTRQLGAYFGLVPCQDASADKNRLGHITRDGPPVMRKLICEATWTAIKKCPAFKRVLRAGHGRQARAQEDRHRRRRAPDDPRDGRDAANAARRTTPTTKDEHTRTTAPRSAASLRRQ